MKMKVKNQKKRTYLKSWEGWSSVDRSNLLTHTSVSSVTLSLSEVSNLGEKYLYEPERGRAKPGKSAQVLHKEAVVVVVVRAFLV